MAEFRADELFIDIVDRALAAATAAGAAYADVRVVARREEDVALSKSRGATIRADTTQGFGVRVLMDGLWGFAASADLTPPSAEQTARRAVSLAAASAFLGTPGVRLLPLPAAEMADAGPCEEDPFRVSLEEKLALLEECAAQTHAEPAIRSYSMSLHVRSEQRLFASSDGVRASHSATEVGGGIQVTASDGHRVQRRSYPNVFGWHAERGGFERVRSWVLPRVTARMTEEAAALLVAPACPAGKRTLILSPSMVAIQLHESIGHAAELDRVLGLEKAGAGGSFLTLGSLGQQVAAPLITITADSTMREGLGTFVCDDEGVPARRTVLVAEGRLTNFLSTRETAASAGLASSAGCARAEGWQRPPLLRMTNVNLEPGPWELEALIAETDDGLFLDTCASWSIDDRRLNFQFAAEAAWEINNGKLGRLLRNPVYHGVTPSFWMSCDAVCREVRDFGVGRCFKGQPGQLARVTHRVPAARFRGVQVLGGVT